MIALTRLGSSPSALDKAHDAYEEVQSAALAEHDASVEAEQVAAETQSAEEVQPLQQDPAAGQNEQQKETQEQLATTEPSDEAELAPEELQLDGEVQVTPPELQLPRLWGVPVYFRMYANYAAFIDRAEVRIFAADQSLEAAPLDVVAVDPAGLAEWQPTAEHIAAPMRELKYVLRAYGKNGAFDETKPQPLWLVYEDGAEADAPPEETPKQEGELLAGYGESGLSLHNIALGSGTVKVRGANIPAHHSVWVAGRQVPVDPLGNFVAEEILPAGHAHRRSRGAE